MDGAKMLYFVAVLLACSSVAAVRITAPADGGMATNVTQCILDACPDEAKACFAECAAARLHISHAQSHP